MPSVQSNGTRWNFMCRSQGDKTQHWRNSAVSHPRNHYPVTGDDSHTLWAVSRRNYLISVSLCRGARLSVCAQQAGLHCKSAKRELCYFLHLASITAVYEKIMFLLRCSLEKVVPPETVGNKVCGLS